MSAYASAWFAWPTPSAPLTITLAGSIAINSLWFPQLVAPVTIKCNGATLSYVTPATGYACVPLPMGTTTVIVSASGSTAMPVFATSQPFNMSQGVGSGSLLGGDFLRFDTVGIGASSASQATQLQAVSARIPLPAGFSPSSVAVVCAAYTAGCVFNIAYGEATITTTTAAGATATAGNAFFAPAGVSIPAAGTVATYTPNVGTLYPSAGGGELTLRVATVSGGGIGGLVVSIFGEMVNA